MAPDSQTPTIDAPVVDPVVPPTADEPSRVSTPLPTMADLDRLQADLDEIDRVLRALDAEH